jgi:anti-anti-sigma factor
VIPVALRISASAGADGPVVVLSGEADLTTTEMLRETLATQLGMGALLVTVDASELSFLDSASLRVLILAARALQARHGTLVFACPQPLVARILEITGADRLLDVQKSAGLDGSFLARADSPGCSSLECNCVHDGPAGRTDPAWTDPDGYDPSC